MIHGRIGVVLKGYPRLSETFIAQELRGLEKAGLRLALFSMRHPTDSDVHPVHREIEAPVTYLPEYIHHEPLRVLKCVLSARKRPGFRGAVAAWWEDLRHDMSRNRIRRFAQACVLAAELPNDIVHLHAHFIHTPASVAHYASILTGLAWTCSAHAKDIWTSSDRDLHVRLASAQWVVTCTKVGFEHLQNVARTPDKVHHSYHGLDLERFSTPPERRRAVDGSSADATVRLLTVCRAVEKKGLDIMIDALAALPRNCNWHWTHVGGGKLIAALKRRASKSGIADRISWLGALPQAEVLQQYRTSDLFVLPCRIAEDGDRDGLPNVIVEAQSQGLCCLSTTVSGVPEIITSGENGVLIAPDDVQALTRALERTIADPQARERMGQIGEQRVRSRFSSNVSIKHLCRLFDVVLTPAESAV